MKALIQRVSEASVAVDQAEVARIGLGLLVLLGVEAEDTPAKAERLIERIIHYRIFPDEEGRMNLSLQDCAGELLLVSQFTLAADTRKGRRPGFSTAAEPGLGEALYDHSVAVSRRLLDTGDSPRVQTGRFGAQMAVALVNDGPVTFLLES